MALVARGVALDGGADVEEAADAAGLAQALVLAPGDDDLVTRVLVDLAAGLEHGLGQSVDEAAQQLESR